MFPADFPADLVSLLSDRGVRLYVNPPRDPASDEAARTGVSAQWMPTKGDETPPF